ncbi:asparagine synthase [Nonomuraea sp. NPDC047897]|uniref:asparagine synthase n=1 Tax=Nonomuraea sp. NPDC047897 TaxID=3364346 RepID=UPI00371750C3
MVVRGRRQPTGNATAVHEAPMVTITTEPNGTLTLTAGAVCTTPLYATVDRAGALHASWDLTETARHAPTGRLHEVELARLLALWLRYTPATLYADVVRLTERATLTLHAGALQVSLPADADHYEPRPLRPDADVITAFEDLLTAAIRTRVFDPSASVVEVSGGFDSAQVALSLAGLHAGELTSAAVMLGGNPGAQQAHRRRQFLGGRFASDATVPAIPPLAPGGLRSSGMTTSPYEDAYTEATTAMLLLATAGRPATVWTGIGGDELLALTASERPAPPIGHDRAPNPWLSKQTLAALEAADDDLPPITVVNEMTLLQFGYRAPIMLRAGCWPFHPLADPALIRFGEWLPSTWRRGKRLARARLERAGMGTEVTRPQQAENFSDVMQQAIVEYAVPWLRLMLTQGGILLDAGYLDPAGLHAALDRIDASGYTPRDAELFDVLCVEQAAAAIS